MSTVLDDKVKEISKEIEAGREEAATAWKEFDDLRTELAKDGVDVTDESSEAFEQAKEARGKYGTIADRVAKLEDRREELWAMTSEKGSPKIGRETREQIKEGLHSANYGDRIVSSEQYKALKEAGAFNSSGRLGEQVLGQMMSRDEAYAFLASGNRQAAVIVTDGDGDDTVRPLIEPEHRGLIEPRFRPLLLRDLITIGTTDSDSIDYVVETGYVNNAAPTPEATTDAAVGGPVTEVLAGVKPQSRLSFEKKSQTVSVIAHWVAATKKSLGDVARLRTTIDARLRRGLDDVIEDQIMSGDGEDDNLLGILNTEGIQHQERTTGSSLVDDILRAITKVELAFFQVTATGLHSIDWQDIRLTRENEDGSGPYLFGPPSQAGATTLWGRPVVSGPQFVQGQPVAADWRTAEFLIREGVQVLASDSHADFFTRNLVAILAEMQGGLIVPQPEAFCEVSDETSS